MFAELNCAVIRSSSLFRACIALLQVCGLHFRQNCFDFNDRDAQGFLEDHETNISYFLLMLSVLLTIGRLVGALMYIVTLPYLNASDERFNKIWLTVWNISWIALHQIIATVFVWKCKQISIMFQRVYILLLKTPKRAMDIHHVLSMISFASMSIAFVITDMNYNIISYPELLSKQSVKLFYWFLWISNTTVNAAFVFTLILTTANLSIVLDQLFVEILKLECNISLETHEKSLQKKIFSRREIASFREEIPSVGSIEILKSSHITDINSLKDLDLESKLLNVENVIAEVYDSIDLMMSIFGFSILLWLLYGTLETTLSMYFGFLSLMDGSIGVNFFVLLFWRFGGMLLLSSAPDDFNNKVGNITGPI